MAAIQLFYETWQDPMKMADEARMALPESERWITSIVVSPVCLRPNRKTKKQIPNGGRGCTQESLAFKFYS